MSAKPPAPALPDGASLELLRKRAKQVLRALRRGDAAALARLRQAFPLQLPDRELSDRRRGPDREPRLADAQHMVARGLGFASWPALVRRVEESQPPALQAERLLAAVRDRPRLARTLLRRNPALGQANLFTACVAGDASLVERSLRADPTQALTVHAPHGWAPLLYVAASPLHRDSAERAAGLRRCAELLLDHGADPDTHMLWQGPEGSSPIPALYFACVSDNVAVAAALLARGANPNDGESIYHAAEHDHERCLELLVAHGGDPGGRHPTWGNTPLYFLAGHKESSPLCATATRGMAWLLAHGADPDVTSGELEETPLHRVAAYGRGPAVAELLLAHGATLDARRQDGRTPYALAVRSGNQEMAALLAARGADPAALRPVDELLGACMAADEGAARALLARHPGLLADLDSEGRQAFALAVEERREASVRLMHALGFDLAWEGGGGGTPLHHAAWHGNPAMTRLLLTLGAPVDQRDSVYGSSALGWAAHGSAHCRRADDDYCAVVALLLDAGAGREAAINRWGAPLGSMGSRRVVALLRERGFAP